MCALAPAGAAQELPVSEALARAVVLDEQEHDARGALAAYLAVADDEAEGDGVRRHAALRAAVIQRRLGVDEAEVRALLERAIGGEGVAADDGVAERARALLAQPLEAEARARELHARAAALCARIADTPGQEAELVQDLLWLGEAAVPAVIDALSTALDQPYAGAPRSVVFAQVLWQLGGTRAAAFLRRKRDAPEEHRLVLAEASRVVAPDLVEEHAALLVDADAAVVQAVVDRLPKHGVTLRPAQLVAALDHESVEVRVRVLEYLRGHLHFCEGARMSAFVERLVPRLGLALDSVDPAEGRVAVRVLRAIAMQTRSSRHLLMDRLTSGPLTGAQRDALVLSNGQTYEPRVPVSIGSAEDVDRVGAMLVALRDSVDGESAGTLSNGLIPQLLKLYMNAWQRPALPVVVSAYQLRALHPNLVYQWLRDHAAADDVAEVLGQIEGMPFDPSLLNALPTGAAHWPLIRAWAERSGVQPGGDGDAVAAVLYRASRAATPDALALVRAWLSRPAVAKHWEACLSGLLESGGQSNAPGVAALMHELAVWPVEDSSREHRFRNGVVAWLTRQGDVRLAEITEAVVSMVGNHQDSYVPGVDASRVEQALPLTPGGTRQARRWPTGAEWLIAGAWRGNVWQPWHGFDEAQWIELLRPRASNDLKFAARAFAAGGSAQGYGVATPALVDLVAEVCLRALRAGRADKLLHDAARAVLGAARQAAYEGERVGTLWRELLLSGQAQLQKAALGWLAGPPEPAQHRTLLDALGRTVDRQVAEEIAAALRTGGAELSVEDLARALQSDRAPVLEVVLAKLAPQLGAAALPQVLPVLQREPGAVRAAACAYLGSLGDLRAVPPLLVALRDADAGVRAAATEALRAVRFYHEQKAHWDRVAAGQPQLSSQAAAAALLQQASADQPRARRLLAIAALGRLGVPEALPQLIEWVDDADAEIAAAATAAIAQVQAGGKAR